MSRAAEHNKIKRTISGDRGKENKDREREKKKNKWQTKVCKENKIERTTRETVKHYLALQMLLMIVFIILGTEKITKITKHRMTSSKRKNGHPSIIKTHTPPLPQR